MRGRKKRANNRPFRPSIKWAETPDKREKRSVQPIGSPLSINRKKAVDWLKGFGDMAVPLYSSNHQSLPSAPFLAAWQRVEKNFFYTLKRANNRPFLLTSFYFNRVLFSPVSCPLNCFLPTGIGFIPLFLRDFGEENTVDGANFTDFV